MPLTTTNPAAKFKSGVMYALCIVFAASILLLLLLVTGYLVSIGFKSINIAFFTKEPIPIGEAGSPGGMRNDLIGTVILIFLAGSIGVPLGILTGVYLAEYNTASRLSGTVRFICDILVGVPSIVVGILGYELVVRPMGTPNGWAAALGLAFIMVPIIARTTEEMLRLVPSSYREASTALGSTKSRTILRVIIPSAAGSLVTGVMLALARVAGETAPLLFTAGSSRLLTFKPNQPFPALTTQIYTYATGPFEQQKRQAWAGILVLITLIFALNLSIRYFARTRKSA